MNLRQLSVAAAGLGSAALVACGGQPIQIQPAAATRTTSTAPAGAGSAGSASSASGTDVTASGAPALPVAPAQPADPTGCDAGAWTGAISPEGRPAGLDAGDSGAVYVWHDAGGWHIRTTDQRPVDHHYTGTIRLAPAAASFTALRTVRTENDDRVRVDGSNVLHYDFHTFASVDGVDFRVTCAPERRGERLAFHTEFDGHPVADRVRIGSGRTSPRTADFSFVRAT
jgi:hypothetical protein